MEITECTSIQYAPMADQYVQYVQDTWTELKQEAKLGFVELGTITYQPSYPISVQHTQTHTHIHTLTHMRSHNSQTVRWQWPQRDQWCHSQAEYLPAQQHGPHSGSWCLDQSVCVWTVKHSICDKHKRNTVRSMWIRVAMEVIHTTST